MPMSPRRDIRLTAEEQDAFLREATKAALATVDGDDRYSELRGLMIRGRCDVIEDPARVEEVIRASAEKRAGSGAAAEPGALASAPKRVVLKIMPGTIASWDHRKLGVRY